MLRFDAKQGTKRFQCLRLGGKGRGDFNIFRCRCGNGAKTECPQLRPDLLSQVHIPKNQIDIFQNGMAFLHFLPEIFYRGAAVQNIAHMAFRQPVGGKIFIDAFRNIRLAMDKIFRDDRQTLGNGNHCIDCIGRKIIFNAS